MDTQNDVGQPNEEKQFSAPSPTYQRRRNLKSATIILGAVALIAVAATLVYSNKGSLGQPHKPTASKSPGQKVAGLEIAQQLGMFVGNSMAASSSAYICTPDLKEGCKVDPAKTGKNRDWIIRALNNLAKVDTAHHFKEQADFNLEAVLKLCSASATVCTANLLALYDYYKDTGNQTVRDQKFKSALLAGEKPSGYDLKLPEAIQSSAGTRLEVLYNVTQDKQYLNLLKKQADALMADGLKGDTGNRNLPYQTTGKQVTLREVYGVTSHLLPAYRATKDQRYLQAAEATLASADILSHWDIVAHHELSMFSLTVLQAYEELAQAVPTSHDVYMSQAELVAQNIITNYLDSPYKKRYTGQYSLLQSAFEPSNGKDVNINAWFAHLLLNLKDKQFTL